MHFPKKVTSDSAQNKDATPWFDDVTETQAYRSLADQATKWEDKYMEAMREVVHLRGWCSQIHSDREAWEKEIQVRGLTMHLGTYGPFNHLLSSGDSLETLCRSTCKYKKARRREQTCEGSKGGL